MRWFDGKINSVKNSLIPYVLHGINEEIYDEIVEKVKFHTLDKYYKCPNCGALKKEFKKDTSNAIWVEKDNPSLCFLEDNYGIMDKVIQ